MTKLDAIPFPAKLASARSFREVFDTTPTRYVKMRRLHAARRLREGSGPELKVTHVALACGFEHLSYFAQDYRALFGEYPSETLGNSRGLAPSGAHRE
jgi:AraC family ethanolamine operon transcriptional activator